MSVSIRGVCAHYVAGKDVLHNLSLEIPAGKVTTVLGASGSGKTTLLRVLAGLHSPSQGRVFVDGADITDVPVERRRVGLVPQEGALFQHLTVAGNIAYGLRGVSRRRAASHPRVQEMLALVGLEGLEDRLPSQLSGGQQQRVALARALAPEPKLVLLDEPFSALDPSLRMRVRDEVFAILRQQNLPTLLITHDQQEALSCSDLVAVLRDGHLVQVGTPRELYSSPVDEWVAGFVGDACILPAGVVGDRLGHLVVARPEQLQISRVEDLENVLPSGQVYATVQGTRYLGHSLLVDLLVDAPGGVSYPLHLTARMDGEHAVVPAGTKVCVSARRPLYKLS